MDRKERKARERVGLRRREGKRGKARAIKRWGAGSFVSSGAKEKQRRRGGERRALFRRDFCCMFFHVDEKERRRERIHRTNILERAGKGAS